MRILISIFIFTFIFFLAFPVSAQTLNPCDPDLGPPPPECQTVIKNPLTSKTFSDLVNNVAAAIRDIMIYAVAPLMVVIGGIQIMTAASNKEQVQKGIHTIKWALIGVIILIIASGLVSLIKDILGVTGS